MKIRWHYLFSSVLIVLFYISACAQDTSRYSDSSLFRRNGVRQGDSSRPRRFENMSSLFSDSAKPTSSDFQIQIERTYLVLNNIDNKSDLGSSFNTLRQRLADNDSVLAVLKDNVLNNTRALNLRNLQVFRTLLQDVQLSLRADRALLDSSENRLSTLKSTMRGLLADTLLKQLLHDSAMRQQFDPQLKEMRQAWRASSRHLRESVASVNLLQTEASAGSITATLLLRKVSDLLNTSAARIFGKEINYLWEKDNDTIASNTRSSFKKAFEGEKKALHYYFKDSGNNRLLLLLIGLLFFAWIYINIRILRSKQSLSRLTDLGFNYLPSAFVISPFIVIFCIAPLFDLHAPAAYIESMQLLLMIVVSIISWKKWPRQLFICWIAMIILYFCFSFSHHIIDPGFWQRSGLLVLNIISIFVAIRFRASMHQKVHLRLFLRFVINLLIVMNALAILCNLFGRFSLAQILGTAAIFSFTQAVGLSVFHKICMEAILLQIVTSRTRLGVQSGFEYEPVVKSFSRPIFFLVALLWLMVFTSNLNVYSSLFNQLSDFLQTPRHLGNAYFTIGGILLFFLIIWIAHLLQRYVGYFFGDTGTEDELQHKGQRSRLLIARLIVLCLGYLLAVAASGVPVDKITIVLGALGVGIGLGLQNIVSNFVSGIILIFDRPLQIGDLVEVGDKSGKVKEIGVRSSTLLTRDGAEVIIPNGDILSRQIINWTLTNTLQRLEIDLSVTGSTDTELLSSSIKEAMQASKYIAENREPQVFYSKVNEDGADLKTFFWCSDVFQSEEARSEVLLLLHKKLKANNIQIK